MAAGPGIWPKFHVLAFRKPWSKGNYGFIALRNRTVTPATELFMEQVLQIEEDINA